MLHNPKITIITPSFNQGPYIEQTIDSVISQNYPNLEYIIMDGGSTDGSVGIIKKYAKHLTYWASEPDNGQSHAINKGLQRATGDIVNWLNSDDYYEPDTLPKIAELFRDENTNVVCGRSRIFTDDGSRDFFSDGTDVYPNNPAKTIGWARIDQPETFFRRETVGKMGLLNENLHYVMDKEWWMRYLLHFGLEGICQTDTVLVNFRLHGNSKTVSQKAGFDRETHGVFYSLADICGLAKEKQILARMGEAVQVLETRHYQQFDANLIRNAIHYYLLHKADEFYYTHQRAEAKYALQGIDELLLIQADRQLLQKLKQRMNLPVWMTELLRKLTH